MIDMCFCTCEACRRDDCIACVHIDTPADFADNHAYDIPTRTDEVGP